MPRRCPTCRGGLALNSVEPGERTTVEICGTCGAPANPAGSYWFAPNDLWNEVNGSPNGFRCIPCFTDDCRAKGINVAWTTTEPSRDATEYEERRRALGALAAKVAEVGSALCCYLPGHGDPEMWATSRCDCKFGASGTGEQTGCPEARALYRMLTPSAHLASRSRGNA